MSVYIIAEIGVNHNGNIDIAKQLILAAQKAGCNCVKFQTYKTEELVTEYANKAKYQIENTKKAQETQFQMLKKLELKYEDFSVLKQFCQDLGIDFLSTPFDKESVDLLEKLGVTQYKVSSGDLTNKPLLQYIAAKGKKIMLSTGMATLDEIKDAIQWINEMDNEKIILFHCTSNYPAPLDSVNMNAMLTLKKEFPYPVGYSDHTEGIEISMMAAAMGAVVIEKHFTLDKKMEGPDHKASVEPNELAALVQNIRKIEKAFGTSDKMPTPAEFATRDVARKSLVFARDLKKGQYLTQQDLKCKRPGTGIPPKYYDVLIHKTLRCDCYKDELVRWEDLDINIHDSGVNDQ